MLIVQLERDANRVGHTLRGRVFDRADYKDLIESDSWCWPDRPAALHEDWRTFGYFARLPEQ